MNVRISPYCQPFSLNTNDPENNFHFFFFFLFLISSAIDIFATFSTHIHTLLMLMSCLLTCVQLRVRVNFHSSFTRNSRNRVHVIRSQFNDNVEKWGNWISSSFTLRFRDLYKKFQIESNLCHCLFKRERELMPTPTRNHASIVFIYYSLFKWSFSSSQCTTLSYPHFICRWVPVLASRSLKWKPLNMWLWLCRTTTTGSDICLKTSSIKFKCKWSFFCVPGFCELNHEKLFGKDSSCSCRSEGRCVVANVNTQSTCRRIFTVASLSTRISYCAYSWRVSLSLLPDIVLNGGNVGVEWKIKTRGRAVSCKVDECRYIFWSIIESRSFGEKWLKIFFDRRKMRKWWHKSHRGLSAMCLTFHNNSYSLCDVLGESWKKIHSWRNQRWRFSNKFNHN